MLRNVQVGRSGRFGHLGLAVNLVTYEDRFKMYVVPSFQCSNRFFYSVKVFLVIYHVLKTGIRLSKNLGPKSNQFLLISIKQSTVSKLVTVHETCLHPMRGTRWLKW